jgi:hypothetical protein
VVYFGLDRLDDSGLCGVSGLVCVLCVCLLEPGRSSAVVVLASSQRALELSAACQASTLAACRSAAVWVLYGSHTALLGGRVGWHA